MQQGDYLILGAFFSERQVGIYYMAYALSVQPIMLLGTNLRTLLIPIISKLNEQTSRKEGAYFRTTKVILFFTFLFSGFLFVNAEPLINLIFSEKWYDVIPLLQILALGMAFRPIMIASEAYMEGEGKFHLKAITTIIISLIFLAATISIGRISVISFSIIVGFVFLSGSILFFFSAIGMKRETLSKLKDLALKPLTIVSGTSIVNIIAYRISDGHNYSEIFSLTLGLIIFMSIPFVIVKCLDENLWADMKMILNKLSKKMSNNAAAA
jgi:O-antigen/teichoic acid export membrane protein